MRLAVALLLALSLPAQAAITFVGGTNSTLSSTLSRTVSDTGLGGQEHDFYLLQCTIKDNTTPAFNSISGWTLIEDTATTADSVNNRYALWYRRRGASDVGSATCTHTGTAAAMKLTLAIFRGVHRTDPFYVAYSKSSHFGEVANDANGAARPIGTVDPGVAVVLAHFHNQTTSDSLGAPSGYTLLGDGTVSTRNIQRNHAFAMKTISSSGTETPGVWTHSGATAFTDVAQITLALRPHGENTWIRRRR